MNFAEIKGFIFDLDGVISKTSILHSKAWHQIADKVNTPWNEKLANDLKGLSRMDSLALILQSGNHENDYTDTQKQALAKEKNENYLKLVDSMKPTDILPGIKEFLVSLELNGYKIALASASKNSPKVLEKLNLSNYFSEVVDPTSLKNGKPDPEIYTKGDQLLGLKPEECIGIEDAEVGIRSINSANEVSIGIGDEKVLKNADIIFSDTSFLTIENIRDKMNN